MGQMDGVVLRVVGEEDVVARLRLIALEPVAPGVPEVVIAVLDGIAGGVRPQIVPVTRQLVTATLVSPPTRIRRPFRVRAAKALSSSTAPVERSRARSFSQSIHS
jgi:hypothetical protein